MRWLVRVNYHWRSYFDRLWCDLFNWLKFGKKFSKNSKLTSGTTSSCLIVRVGGASLVRGAMPKFSRSAAILSICWSGVSSVTLCSSRVLSGMLFSERLKSAKFCGKSNTFFDSEHIELSLDEELKVLCVLRLAQNGHNVVARVLLGEAVELADGGVNSLVAAIGSITKKPNYFQTQWVNGLVFLQNFWS